LAHPNALRLGNLPFEKKVLAVSMLAEGASIRSIERVTGLHRDTTMRLGIRVGKGCAASEELSQGEKWMPAQHKDCFILDSAYYLRKK
jgi:hypothetical protein